MYGVAGWAANGTCAGWVVRVGKACVRMCSWTAAEGAHLDVGSIAFAEHQALDEHPADGLERPHAFVDAPCVGRGVENDAEELQKLEHHAQDHPADVARPPALVQQKQSSKDLWPPLSGHVSCGRLSTQMCSHGRWLLHKSFKSSAAPNEQASSTFTWRCDTHPLIQLAA